MSKMIYLNEMGRSTWRWMTVCVLALAVSACGGSDGDAPAPDPVPPAPSPAPDPQPEPTPQPEPEPSEPAVGDLLNAVSLGTFNVGDIGDALGGSKLPGLMPYYGVTTYRLSYLTEDQDGELVQASGLVAVPMKPATETSDLISYQHATIFYNDEAPSQRLEASEPPMVLASLGYIVVAADYVGFGDSVGTEHPYLQSRPTARAVIDMLTAFQQWQKEELLADTRRFSLVGYSEGAYASMAAQREMERSGHPLLDKLQISILGGGPYDMQATLDGLLQRVRQENKYLGSLVKPGNLSRLPREIRREVRRLLQRQLIPDDADVGYSPRVLDHYLDDDRDALLEENSVHWGWTPGTPVYLFHGPEDGTVPFAAAMSALDELEAAQGAPVSLYECRSVSPTGHTECVPEYFEFTLRLLQDLNR